MTDDHQSSTPDAGPHALYVHVPLCIGKCAYCDFYSVPLAQRDPGPLVEAMGIEVDARVRQAQMKIDTLFIGGGTPTILPAPALECLLAATGRACPGHPPAEFTVEANPATLQPDKVDAMNRAGVTRVSIGAQSFVPAELAILQRKHCPDDIDASVRLLRSRGIRQISLDLIFGIPGQTMASWAQSLRQAVDLGPDHLSCYGLTYEPETPLTASRDEGDIQPIDEELEADLFVYTSEALATAGYEQYEISNFAKPERRCQHNLIYWRNGPYLGVGPSAVGAHGGRRYRNVSDIDEYVRRMARDGNAESESELITRDALMIEMIMMQLRLTEGLSIDDFERRCGVRPTQRLSRTLADLTARGLVCVTETHIKLTRPGRLIGDRVIRELVSAL